MKYNYPKKVHRNIDMTYKWQGENPHGNMQIEVESKVVGKVANVKFVGLLSLYNHPFENKIKHLVAMR